VKREEQRLTGVTMASVVARLFNLPYFGIDDQWRR
jgi:hypothetical protein